METTPLLRVTAPHPLLPSLPALPDTRQFHPSIASHPIYSPSVYLLEMTMGTMMTARTAAMRIVMMITMRM